MRTNSIWRIFEAGLRNEWPAAAPPAESSQVPSPIEVHHELLTQTTVLLCEPKDDMAEMFDEYVNDFNPGSTAEFDLIQEMASACWRTRRLWALETNMIAEQMEFQTADDALTAISGAFTNLAAMPKYTLIARREAHLGRVYQRALRNLVFLQKNTRPAYS